MTRIREANLYGFKSCAKQGGVTVSPELEELLLDTMKTTNLYLWGLYGRDGKWTSKKFINCKNSRRTMWVLDVDTGMPVQVPKLDLHVDVDK